MILQVEKVETDTLAHQNVTKRQKQSNQAHTMLGRYRSTNLVGVRIVRCVIVGICTWPPAAWSARSPHRSLLRTSGQQRTIHGQGEKHTTVQCTEHFTPLPCCRKSHATYLTARVPQSICCSQAALTNSAANRAQKDTLRHRH